MKKLIAILSLVLSLALCFGALAEQAPAADPAEPAQVETAAEQDPTKEAVDAYKALKKDAKTAKKLDALKEELDAYVADGKLTQEQADLVLKYYTEKYASHGTKGNRNGQPGETPDGQGQQKQKPDGQAPNGRGGRGGKHTKPTDSGASGADAASGATKKNK